jgi:hypothetical protein
MARAMTTALVVLCGVAPLAAAGPVGPGTRTSKVTIETDPPGAKVYFGLKEDGEVCTTPCTVDAPIGETTLIIEAENRRSLIENLTVARKAAKPLKVSYKLELAIGAVVVEGGAGATIKIDDDDKGPAPQRIEGVPAGAHRIVLVRNGATIYDQFVEIEAGGEASVSAPAELAAPPPPRLVAVAPRPARTTPVVAVAGTMDIAFRQFTYDNNRTPATQRDDHEVGQLLAGPIIELWPTTLLDLGVLPGLSLYGRFEFGLNAQPVTVDAGGGAAPTSLSTSWSSLEISVHQRWKLAGAGTIEVGAGYARDRYQFNGNVGEIAIVPDARYSAIRIGGRASLLFGRIEPYLATENRLVLSGGALDKRYKLGTSVNGVHGALGAAVHLGQLEARVEGGLTLYSWSFKPDPSDVAQADGGRDFIQNITFTVGYAY